MRRSPLHLAFGLFGVVSVAIGLFVSWRVGRSPGDDNPIGMIAVAAALLGLVPSWGLVLWARGRGLREHLIWLFCAGVASLPLALCVVVLATVLCCGAELRARRGRGWRRRRQSIDAFPGV